MLCPRGTAVPNIYVFDTLLLLFSVFTISVSDMFMCLCYLFLVLCVILDRYPTGAEVRRGLAPLSPLLAPILTDTSSEETGDCERAFLSFFAVNADGFSYGSKAKLMPPPVSLKACGTATNCPPIHKPSTSHAGRLINLKKTSITTYTISSIH